MNRLTTEAKLNYARQIDAFKLILTGILTSKSLEWKRSRVFSVHKIYSLLFCNLTAVHYKVNDEWDREKCLYNCNFLFQILFILEFSLSLKQLDWQSIYIYLYCGRRVMSENAKQKIDKFDSLKIKFDSRDHCKVISSANIQITEQLNIHSYTAILKNIKYFAHIFPLVITCSSFRLLHCCAYQ